MCRRFIWMLPTIILISCASRTPTHPSIRQESRRLLVSLKPLSFGHHATHAIKQQLKNLDNMDSLAKNMAQIPVSKDSNEGKQYTGNISLIEESAKQLYRECSKLGVIERHGQFEHMKVIIISIIEQKFVEQDIGDCLTNDRAIAAETIKNFKFPFARHLDVEVIKDPNAYTRAKLMDYFKNLSLNYNTFLLVYFTGHGTMLDDGSAHYLNTNNVVSGDYINTGLALNYLKRHFFRAITESYYSTGMLIIDACQATPDINAAQEFRNGIIFTGNSSNDMNSKVTNFGTVMHCKRMGIFTYHLFNTLKNIHLVPDYDKDGFIRMNEFCYYVKQQVVEQTSGLYATAQEPAWHIGKYADGQLVLYQR